MKKSTEVNCKICNKSITDDSQFINDEWYHNNCITSISNKLNNIKDVCIDKRESIKQLENFYKECIINKGDYSSEFNLLLKYDLTLIDIIDIIEK